jgi:uncharacterized membrane protein HdeD (DUF308 family)
MRDVVGERLEDLNLADAEAPIAEMRRGFRERGAIRGAQCDSLIDADSGIQFQFTRERKGNVMNTEHERPMGQATEVAAARPTSERPVRHELHHLQSGWRWLFSLGVLLLLCGIVALIFPAIASVAAINVLGVILLIAGVAMILGAFWAGKWSGFLIQLLVGILYLASGLVVTERPLASILVLTFFLAVSFMVLGVFRTLGALILRFPQWGWALLNGAVTFLCGLVIFRHLPIDALWVIGLLVGLEMLFNGWTWIMLALEIRKSV